MVDVKESLDKLEMYLLELEDKYIDIHTDPWKIQKCTNWILEVFVCFLMQLLKSL